MVQCFRSGAWEVGFRLRPGEQDDQVVHLIPLEGQIERSLQAFRQFLSDVRLDGTISLHVTLANVEGLRPYRYSGEGMTAPGTSRGFDRNVVQCPEVLLDGVGADADPALRDLFGMIWESSGWPRQDREPTAK